MPIEIAVLAVFQDHPGICQFVPLDHRPTAHRLTVSSLLCAPSLPPSYHFHPSNSRVPLSLRLSMLAPSILHWVSSSFSSSSLLCRPYPFNPSIGAPFSFLSLFALPFAFYPTVAHCPCLFPSSPISLHAFPITPRFSPGTFYPSLPPSPRSPPALWPARCGFSFWNQPAKNHGDPEIFFIRLNPGIRPGYHPERESPAFFNEIPRERR